MERTLLIKENNETRKVVTSSMKELTKLCSKKPHLCVNCSNADAKNCEKIKRPFSRKLEISRYSFIKEGYQVINSYGLEKFIVSECDNYEKFKNKNCEREEREKLAASLAEIYYGTNTIEEAQAIMHHDYVINRKIRRKNK